MTDESNIPPLGETTPEIPPVIDATKPGFMDKAKAFAENARDKATQYSAQALEYTAAHPKAAAGIAAALTAGSLLLPKKEAEVTGEDGTTQTVKKSGIFKTVATVALGALTLGLGVAAFQSPDKSWVSKVANRAAQAATGRGA